MPNTHLLRIFNQRTSNNHWVHQRKKEKKIASKNNPFIKQPLFLSFFAQKNTFGFIGGAQTSSIVAEGWIEVMSPPDGSRAIPPKYMFASRDG